MEKMLFSIIIPTLNEEKYLPKLLTDLSLQKDINFEVIIVDGDSEDATKEQALLFKKKLNVRYINGKKRNVAFQRNFGVQVATGSYLIFFDADVRINPLFSRKLAHSLKKSKGLIFIPKFSPQEKFFQDTTIFSAFNMLLEVSQITSTPFSLGGSLIFEKNYFTYLGGFNEKVYLAEDHEIVQRAKKNNVTATICKKVTVKISLRRFKREGRIELLRKYLIATIHSIKNGRIDKKLFEYKMGGDHYIPNKRKAKTLDAEIRDYFSEIKKIVGKLTTE